MRYVNDLLVLRITSALSLERIEQLNDEFADIQVSGRLEQRGALPEEASEPELAELPRLVMHFNRRNLGRLRKLIDAVNAS
jgi:hypothetical protein